MSSDEWKLLNFLFLAAESHRKKQIPGRDRFLILSLITACEAGFPELAERCREVVIRDSPRHLLSRYANAIAAMQSEEFQVFAKQMRRFCTTERAEQLAQGLGFHAEQELQNSQANTQQLAEKIIQPMMEK